MRKKGKNHITLNENPPTTITQMLAASEVTSTTNEKESGGENSNSRSCDAAGSNFGIVRDDLTVAIEEIKMKVGELNDEEEQVDRYLKYLQEQAEVYNGRKPSSPEFMANLPPDIVAATTAGRSGITDHMYVAYNDLIAMPSYKSATVIGIRSPCGTALEVPDPDQGMKPGVRKYEIYMSSNGAVWSPNKDKEKRSEPINVYMVQPRVQQPVKKKTDYQDQESKDGKRGHKSSFVEDTPPSNERVPTSTSSKKRKKPPENLRSSRPSYTAPLSDPRPPKCMQDDHRGASSHPAVGAPASYDSNRDRHEPGRHAFPVQEPSSNYRDIAKNQMHLSPSHTGAGHRNWNFDSAWGAHLLPDHQHHDLAWGAPPPPPFQGYGLPPVSGYFHPHSSQRHPYPHLSPPRPSLPPKRHTKISRHGARNSKQSPRSSRNQEASKLFSARDGSGSDVKDASSRHKTEPPHLRQTEPRLERGRLKQTGMRSPPRGFQSHSPYRH